MLSSLSHLACNQIVFIIYQQLALRYGLDLKVLYYRYNFMSVLEKTVLCSTEIGLHDDSLVEVEKENLS